MKIFQIEIGGPFAEDDDRVEGYSGWTDMRGCVVIAQDEAEARRLAKAHAEGGFGNEPWWLDPNLTICTELSAGGDARVLFASFPTG